MPLLSRRINKYTQLSKQFHLNYTSPIRFHLDTASDMMGLTGFKRMDDVVTLLKMLVNIWRGEINKMHKIQHFIEKRTARIDSSHEKNWTIVLFLKVS